MKLKIKNQRHTSPNTGGILLRGTRLHNDNKRPDARLARKRWNARRMDV